jgi:hypothetical protein
VEDIRQNYINVEEQKALDELTRPKEVKGHAPGQPLEMPGGRKGNAARAAGDTPAAAPATPPPPQLNVNPAQRNLDKIEK